MGARPLLVLALALGCLAGPAAGEDLWQRFAARVREAAAYSFRYDYEGPEGSYRFRYSYEAPGRLRTEILEGSARGAGTVITYDPGSKPGHVTVDTGIVAIPRRITARDIAGTSLYIPLYQQLLGKVGGRAADQAAADDVEGAGLTRLEFGPDAEGWSFTAWLDPQGNLVRFVEHRRGERHKEFRFSEVQVQFMQQR